MTKNPPKKDLKWMVLYTDLGYFDKNNNIYIDDD